MKILEGVFIEIEYAVLYMRIICICLLHTVLTINIILGRG